MVDSPELSRRSDAGTSGWADHREDEHSGLRVSQVDGGGQR
jgi:hypothetical protein